MNWWIYGIFAFDLWSPTELWKKKRIIFRSCFAVDEFSIIVVSLKGYAITKMSSHTFFPIVSRFPSVSFHNCIFPTHSVVLVKSGWFCPDGIFHNYFFSIIVREESQWLELCKQSEYVCTFNSKIVHNPAHTSRTAQRLFSLFPLYCTYVWLLSVHTAIMRLKELCMYLQGCAVQPMTTYSQQFSMYGLFCMWILYSKLFILIDPGQNVS